MQISATHVLLDALPPEKSDGLARLRAEVMAGFSRVVWPVGASQFTIRPVRKGNGVGPIKTELMAHLVAQGWDLERTVFTPEFPGQPCPGPVDAYVETHGLRACLEWETGNVASSYRVLLKMMDALAFDEIDVGFLVVSKKGLARYLTDRVGTDSEIAWTFRMMRRLLRRGRIEILVMDADAYDDAAPLIPKQSSGNGAVNARRQGAAKETSQGSLFAHAGIVETVRPPARPPPD